MCSSAVNVETYQQALNPRRGKHHSFWQAYYRLPHWVAPTLAAVGALGVCVLLAVRDPREPGSYGTCFFLALTGKHCPGCGSTRAISRLVEFDLVDAFRYNVITVMLVPVLVFLWAKWAFSQSEPAFKSRFNGMSELAVISYGAVLVAFGVVRNLPWEPFSSLAPPTF